MFNILLSIMDIVLVALYGALVIMLVLQNKHLKEQNATLQNLLNAIVAMDKKERDTNV
jgi:branched-subunit amino acid transport protein